MMRSRNLDRLGLKQNLKQIADFNNNNMNIFTDASVKKEQNSRKFKVGFAAYFQDHNHLNI